MRWVSRSRLRGGCAVRCRVTDGNGCVSDWCVHHVNMSEPVMMKMGHMQMPEAPSAKHKRKKAEAETDRETDQVKV